MLEMKGSGCVLSGLEWEEIGRQGPTVLSCSSQLRIRWVDVVSLDGPAAPAGQRGSWGRCTHLGLSGLVSEVPRWLLERGRGG